MEATLDFLLCCWVDGDDYEFCFRKKQHENFRQDHQKKRHRRGRSETFRINVNASFDGISNQSLDCFTESFDRSEQQQGLEIVIHDTDGTMSLIDLKDSGIAKEKEDTRKRKSRYRSKRRAPRAKRTEIGEVRSHHSCPSDIETIWREVDSERGIQLTSKNDTIEVCDSLLTSSSSADKHLNHSSCGSTIEVFYPANNEKVTGRETELIIRNRSIKICDSELIIRNESIEICDSSEFIIGTELIEICNSSSSLASSLSSLSSSSSSSLSSKKDGGKRRSRKQNIMKKIRNMQFNKRSSTDNISTSSSTLSTDTNIDSVITPVEDLSEARVIYSYDTNIDSVITREEESSETEVIYSCEQKIGSRSVRKPSNKSFGFMSRMVYGSSVKNKI